MEKKIGFIGCGNMARAMVGGIVRAGVVSKDQIVMSDPHEAAREAVFAEFAVATTEKNVDVVRRSDIVVVAVKPHLYPAVLGEVVDALRPSHLVVTIAAGQTIAAVEAVIGGDRRVVRTMPNTPALVGEGMSALCPNANVTEEELQEVRGLFAAFGKAEVVPERLIDAVIGVSGSAPAYIFMVIEAMADAAVAAGMARGQAYTFASQAVLGSAKMVLKTGRHPGELKDAVCSPGGTTIAAVEELEERGLRAAIVGGVRACIARSREMSS